MKQALLLPFASVFVAIFLLNLIISIYTYIQIKNTPIFSISSNGPLVESNAISLIVQNSIGLLVSIGLVYFLRTQRAKVITPMNIVFWLAAFGVLLSGMVLQYSSAQLSMIDNDQIQNLLHIDFIRNLNIAMISTSGFALVGSLALVGYNNLN